MWKIKRIFFSPRLNISWYFIFCDQRQQQQNLKCQHFTLKSTCIFLINKHFCCVFSYFTLSCLSIIFRCLCILMLLHKIKPLSRFNETSYSLFSFEHCSERNYEHNLWCARNLNNGWTSWVWMIFQPPCELKWNWITMGEDETKRNETKRN